MDIFCQNVPPDLYAMLGKPPSGGAGLVRDIFPIKGEVSDLGTILFQSQLLFLNMDGFSAWIHKI